MTKIISIINQKGGVGKTTISQHLIVGLRKKNFRVLAIDFDTQSDLSFAFNIKNKFSIYDVINNPKQNINEAIENDFLAGSPLLSSINFKTKHNKEYLLKTALTKIIYKYDYIIIDTPPALSDLTINALTASDEVIIASQADILSLKGIGQLAQTIQAVKEYTNTNLTVKGILLTRYNNRTVLAKSVANMLEETATQLNTKLFNTKIRECNAIKEAQAERSNIFDYKKYSTAGLDLQNFINEYLEE